MATNPQPFPEGDHSRPIHIDRRYGKRSDNVRKQISLGVKRYMRRNPEKVTALSAKLREERAGKPQPRLRGRTGPQGSTSKPTLSWEIVKLRANGASLPAIAKECGMKSDTPAKRVA